LTAGGATGLAAGAAGLAGGNRPVFCVIEKFTGLVGIVIGVGLVPCDPLTYGTLLARRGRVDAGGVERIAPLDFVAICVSP